MAIRHRVALIIESSRAYGRGLLRGISAYAHAHGPWSIYVEPRAPRDPLPHWLDDWDGDAIIARIESKQMARKILAKKLPTVDLRGLLMDLKVPLLETNDECVPQMAFEHLRERGFWRFAFVGFVHHNYSDTRCAAFTKIVRDAGFECRVYETPRELQEAASWEEVQHGLVAEEHLPKWLQSLPKPIGLMACNDVRGQQVLNACREAGIAVPDDIAVIGVDNDEVLCDLADPPLSSVAPNTYQIGYEAAALVDRLLEGGKPAKKPTYIDPIGVVTRVSTDVLAIEDRQIAAAVRFIRDHASEGIDVDAVVDAVPLSRSSLERRFRAALGRSPHDEILRARLNRVKDLLVRTDYPLTAIAQMTGFEHPEYMSVLFKRKEGITPGQYRARSQGVSEPD